MKKFLVLNLFLFAVIVSACAGPTVNERAANGTATNSSTQRNSAGTAQANSAAARTPAAQATPATPGAIPFPDSPRIPLKQAKAEFDKGTAVFIDTHNANTFAAEHVRGAINISPADLDAKINLIPKGKKIIVYCS